MDVYDPPSATGCQSISIEQVCGSAPSTALVPRSKQVELSISHMELLKNARKNHTGVANKPNEDF